MSFGGERVLVTGGSSGLGLALATRLAGEGARLALVARDGARLELARESIMAAFAGASVACAAVDVSDAASVVDAFDRLAGEMGGLDMLINSAGALREGHYEELTGETFRAVMEVNFFGLEAATRAALPHLKRNDGRVVNISSLGGLAGTFGYTAYNASKYAVVGFSEALRFELAPQRVSVHVVCPPEFDSPMVAELNRSRTIENRSHIAMLPEHDIETIAEETLSGVARGRFLIVPGRGARLAAAAIRHLPAVTRKAGDARVRKAYRGPQPPAR